MAPIVDVCSLYREQYEDIVREIVSVVLHTTFLLDELQKFVSVTSQVGNCQSKETNERATTT